MTRFSNMMVRMSASWLAIILIAACVDDINFKVPPPQSQTVIEGMISDSPGPYTVKISTALHLDSDTTYHRPVQHAKIKLLDDQGHVEEFTETKPGTYITGGNIRGQVGHSYHIRLEMPDGNIFESEPDTIQPVGSIDSIRHKFETKTVEKNFGLVQADVFNIYVDSHAAGQDDPGEHFVRWRYTGTYKVQTNPELHAILLQGSTWLKDPLICSGYVVEPGFGGGILVQKEECTCCTCWVKQFESKPQLSDVQLVNDNEFRNIKVAEVPVNQATFFDKFFVNVEQMSLTRKTFDFFRMIRAQKEGASSLFQPPSGEIRGNIKPVNSNAAVIGIFWATSISSKSIFIQKSDVPYNIAPIYFVPIACYDYYPHASINKPDLW
jgi:hypothetical protein